MALGILLALAELVSWWGVLVLPVTVAVMVKLNDVVAGALTRPVARRARREAPQPARRPRRRRRGADEFAMDDLALSRARTVDLRSAGPAGAIRTVADADRGAARADRRPVGSAQAGPASARRCERDRPPGSRRCGRGPIELDLREQRARQSAARRYE